MRSSTTAAKVAGSYWQISLMIGYSFRLRLGDVMKTHFGGQQSSLRHQQVRKRQLTHREVFDPGKKRFLGLREDDRLTGNYWLGNRTAKLRQHFVHQRMILDRGEVTGRVECVVEHLVGDATVEGVRAALGG